MKRLTKRKLTKSSLDELAERMPVLSEDFLKGAVGGYKNDCFWRCVAYLVDSGNYSESDAENYANNFNPENGYYYKKDSSVSEEDMDRYQRENFYSFSGTIMKIDPNKVPGLTGSTDHAVVFKSIDEETGWYIVIDPQQEGREYMVPPGSLLKSYVYAGPDSGGGDVSGSYGDTSGGGDDVSGSYGDTSGGSGNITGIWNP